MSGLSCNGKNVLIIIRGNDKIDRRIGIDYVFKGSVNQYLKTQGM